MISIPDTNQSAHTLHEKTAQVTVATYNVHQWIGTDGRYDPRRVMRVIRELDADIIALQEATIPWGHNPEPVDTDYFLRLGGKRAVFGPTMSKKNAHFGNILLTGPTPLSVRRYDLSVRNREPRGVIDAEFQINGRRVRVVATHLGLMSYERRRQARALLDIVGGKNGRAVDLTVLMGDFNIWFRHSPLLRRLQRLFSPAPALRTYPSRFPLFSLDRILIRPQGLLKTVTVHQSGTARVASDHLPVKAVIRI